ncbi:MAG: hypothetical protein ACYTDY_15000 [Planctomycetota bacterium]|jgi:hypothetical protein
MSEQTAPPAGAPKRLSGLLLLSLGLSFASVFLLNSRFGMFLVVVGPITAGVLAWVGRRRARQDPSVIGPRFAIFCIGFAVASLLLQGWAVYRSWPYGVFQREVFEKQKAFVDGLRNREYDKLYELMGSSYRQSHSGEDLKAHVAEAFPGDQPIEIDMEDARIRKDDVDEGDFTLRWETFFGEEKGVFRFVWPLRFEKPDGEIRLDFDMEVERTSHAEFVATIVGFRAARTSAEADEGEADRGEPPPGEEDESK